MAHLKFLLCVCVAKKTVCQHTILNAGKISPHTGARALESFPGTYTQENIFVKRREPAGLRLRQARHLPCHKALRPGTAPLGGRLRGAVFLRACGIFQRIVLIFGEEMV